jgi:hypothetical protein
MATRGLAGGMRIGLAGKTVSLKVPEPVPPEFVAVMVTETPDEALVGVP